MCIVVLDMSSTVRYTGTTTNSEVVGTPVQYGQMPYDVIISESGLPQVHYAGATSDANRIDSIDASIITAAALGQISAKLGTNYAKVERIVIRIDMKS